MSLLLDALKRAEQEKLAKGGPRAAPEKPRAVPALSAVAAPTLELQPVSAAPASCRADEADASAARIFRGEGGGEPARRSGVGGRRRRACGSRPRRATCGIRISALRRAVRSGRHGQRSPRILRQWTDRARARRSARTIAPPSRSPRRCRRARRTGSAARLRRPPEKTLAAHSLLERPRRAAVPPAFKLARGREAAHRARSRRRLRAARRRDLAAARAYAQALAADVEPSTRGSGSPRRGTLRKRSAPRRALRLALDIDSAQRHRPRRNRGGVQQRQPRSRRAQSARGRFALSSKRGAALHARQPLRHAVAGARRRPSTPRRIASNPSADILLQPRREPRPPRPGRLAPSITPRPRSGARLASSLIRCRRGGAAASPTQRRRFAHDGTVRPRRFRRSPWGRRCSTRGSSARTSSTSRSPSRSASRRRSARCW